ncbi:MAG: LacI family DNA-binding transcriptional regulator [Clostridia bacterium]|nr:LacI family DNA-binding transcriptional regulator [Clostridia bacterium]
MTLSELARLANVSVSVASKAFSGKDGVSEAMREHVFAVAREHGCFQQFYNAPYDRPVVAVIVPEVISKSYIKYIEELKRGMEKKNYTMLLSIGNFDPQMEQTLIKYYTEHGKVDGLVLISGHCDLPVDVPFVRTGQSENMQSGAQLLSDLQGGVDAAVAHLATLGHRRIGFVGEPLTVSKEPILRKALEKCGLVYDDRYVICSQYRFERAGADGIAQLLALPEPPTAVIGSYGYITQGILRELSVRGIEVPREMSVVSLTDNPDPIDPTLDVAVVREETERICALALEELERQMSSEQKSVISHTVPLRFHKGDSIAPPLS